MAAIELIAEQPILYIKERIAVCDGGTSRQCIIPHQVADEYQEEAQEDTPRFSSMLTSLELMHVDIVIPFHSHANLLRWTEVCC
jgi:hypothetical protein